MEEQEKTGSDNKAGEKYFTQAELDKIISDRLARAKATWDKEAEQKAAKEKEELEKANKTAEELTKQNIEELNKQLNSLKEIARINEVKAKMAQSGIQPEKLDRAIRLVDVSKCVGDTGLIQEDLLKTELDSLIKDFPELKVSSKEADGNRIVIGSKDSDVITTKAEEKLISDIFSSAV